MGDKKVWKKFKIITIFYKNCELIGSFVPPRYTGRYTPRYTPRYTGRYTPRYTGRYTGRYTPRYTGRYTGLLYKNRE